MAVDLERALRLAGMRPVPRLHARHGVDLSGKRILLTGASSGIGLERWHDVERTMIINYYAPLRLIRGLAPGMIERGDGHVINVSSWRVMPESSPLFSVYNASKAALSAVSRVIDNEMADYGVHSTTIYYPLVDTPMIAPTRAYQGLAALSADEAAQWMVTAARHRPIRITPRRTLALRALDIVSPRLLNSVTKRSTPKSAV
ncbi:hypothetical protein TUM20984_11860 [Mycobacterium antarcticum]|nr:hypothetical protein TUM20984_11860 [Mycolicibacterium sp. TUM20984]